MSRVKERSKLRQHIKNRRKILTAQLTSFNSKSYVDPNEVEILSGLLQELSALQRQLNAMSQEVDEKQILQRAAKRVDGNR